MSLYYTTWSIGAVQCYDGCIPYFDVPLEPVKETESSDLVIAEGNTIQEDYLKQLIRLLDLTNASSEECYTINTLFSEPSFSDPIVVKPPRKRVLASMEVVLSPKDFKRRLPSPVIS